MKTSKKKYDKFLKNSFPPSKTLKKKLFVFFRTNWPIFGGIGLVVLFFWKFFLQDQIPIPGDFVIGTYFPWLDYKWGYSVGVPVKNPITTDVVSFTYPMRSLAAEMLRRAEVPLWNPYILTGTPLLANFQSAPFSITIPLYFFFDTLTAWSLQIILQHFLALIFTYLLLRHWNLTKLPSFVGGVIVAFSGYNLIWSQWNVHALAASFLPLIILFLEKFIKEKRFKWLAGIAFSLFFQIVSGYPQGTIYSFLTLFVVWMVRIGKEKKKFTTTVLIGVFVSLGLGLAALQILPAYELLGQSQRDIEPLAFEWAFLPFQKVITFVAPDFFGNHSTGNYWGPQDYTSNTGFVGVIALSLALFSLRYFKKIKEIQIGFLLMVMSLIFSFPTPLSIGIWSKGFLGLQAASAHRALILFNFSTAFLAAFGFSKIREFRLWKDIIFILPIGLILAVFGFDAVWNFWVNSNTLFFIGLRNLIIPCSLFGTFIILLVIQKRLKISDILIHATLILLLIIELFRFGWKFTPFTKRDLVFPTTPSIEFLVNKSESFRTTGNDVIPINLRMPYKISTVEGYDAIYPVSIAQFIAFINSENPDADPQGRYATVNNINSPLLNILNTKYLITLKKDEKGNPSRTGAIPAELKTSQYRIAFEDKTTVILDNQDFLPRAFMVYDFQIINDTEFFKNALNFDFKNKLVFSESVDNRFKYLSALAKSTILLDSHSENKSSYNVSSSKDGFLFVSDLYYPGWKVFVDGKEEKIQRANYAFRSVYVPEGDHQIVFSYQPQSFQYGLIISSISLVIIFISPLWKKLFRDYT